MHQSTRKKKLNPNNPKQVTIESTPQTLTGEAQASRRPSTIPQVRRTTNEKQKKKLKQLVDSKTLFDKKLLNESYVLDLGDSTAAFQKFQRYIK
jgi:hypothetical protein